MLRSTPLEELVIPDGTTVEEHDLVTDGDVVVGGQSTVEFGVRGNTVIAGERTRFGGHIEAEGDCRLDMWCDVAADVLVGEDAYLGERVHIGGELKVAGDLDIGDDVDIDDGFEANGWIVIRNPMPTIVFLFVYLSHLLRIGEEDAAEDVLAAALDADRDAQPLLVPRGTHVSDDAWRVSAPARIGDDCRLHGNLRAESLTVGRDTIVFGSLRAKDDLTVGRATEIKGDVTTRNGTVSIGPGVHVWGDVAAENVRLHENATVDGTIRVADEMEMHTDSVLDDADEAAEAMAAVAADLDETAFVDSDGAPDRAADEPPEDEADSSSSSDEAGSTPSSDEAGSETVSPESSSGE
ncbi:Polymer-forming cytoskeletal protein [Halorhabdus tiamatea SARL4B]|uniref:Polymer-forming cytoskeletal protein n=1 Tax=Halorhabdus tiamatea SARL4B TaxID=1033806 RepID=U2E3A1_9EURY|nr:polymer-forming cytoskeletal protein [Halorhabdus tiamatea]ERJ06758.1 Polymer-forming cytoskeletal protein [Halorhabdus tiamatea SARL4B]